MQNAPSSIPVGSARSAHDARDARSRRSRRPIPAWLPYAIVIALSLCAHAIFLPQFLGMESAAFTFYGGDATSQLVPAVSLLERNLLAGNFPWSWEYGLGGDLYAEFCYYYSTSPFFYLMFAVKCIFGAAGGDFYTAQLWRLIGSIAKLALCMALMYRLLHREGASRGFALCGAALYGCSPWFIDNSLMFDYMTDSMVWLPLIMMAYRRFEQTGTWLPLAFAVALCIASNYYFAYINMAFLIVLALVFSAPEGVRREERRSGRGGFLAEYAKRVGALALIAAAGILIASIAFLPAIDAFLQADRTQTVADFSLLPTLQSLAQLPETLFSKGGDLSYLDQQAFAFPLALLAVPLLHWRACSPQLKKKLVLAVAMLVLAFIPAASSVMNGFSYPTNRWLYTVIFAVAFAFPESMQELVRQKRLNPSAMIAIAVLVAAFVLTRDARLEYAAAEQTVLFGALSKSDLLFPALGLAFIVALAFLQRADETRTQRSWSAVAVAVFLCATLLAMPNGPYALISGFRNNGGLEQFAAPGDLDPLLAGSPETQAAYAALQPGSDGFYRVLDEDSTINRTALQHEARAENRSWLLGTYPASTYNSMIGKQLNRALKYDYGVTSTTVSASQYRGLGHRLFLENAWGIQYKLNGTANCATFGYEPAAFGSAGSADTADYDGSSDSALSGVLQNSLANGIDLWYGTQLSEESWNAMDFAERDAMLLQAALVEEGSSDIGTWDGGSPATVADVPLSDETVDFENCSFTDLAAGASGDADGRDASASNGTLLVRKGGGTIAIALPAQSTRGEYLLGFTLRKTDGQSFSLLLNGEEYYFSPENGRWGYPQKNFSLCLRDDSPTAEIAIDEGEYELCDCRLQFNSYEQLATWTAAANSRNLENPAIGGNAVSGSLTTDEAGILAISAPYSAGWSCKIDGESVPVLKVNRMFCGIEVAPGTHTVEFRYANRMLKWGALASLLGVLGVFAAAVLQSRRKRKLS